MTTILKPISLAFADQVDAAGLQGLCSWNNLGVTRNATTSDADWAKVVALVAAHDASAAIPEAVPQTISKRQFAQQAAVAGLISQAEALAWVTAGTIPPELEALVQAIPAGQQFEAAMLVGGAAEFVRSHPVTLALITAFKWTAAQADAFWIAAAKL